MSVGGGGGGIALKDWTDGRTGGEGEGEDPSGGRESEDVYDNEEEEEEEEGRASMDGNSPLGNSPRENCTDVVLPSPSAAVCLSFLNGFPGSLVENLQFGRHFLASSPPEMFSDLFRRLVNSGDFPSRISLDFSID